MGWGGEWMGISGIQLLRTEVHSSWGFTQGWTFQGVPRVQCRSVLYVTLKRYCNWTYVDTESPIILRFELSVPKFKLGLELGLIGWIVAELFQGVSFHELKLTCTCSWWTNSRQFLKMLTVVNLITSAGSLFHSLTARLLKNFCLAFVFHLGLNNFRWCRHKLFELSTEWKKIAALILSSSI